MLGDGDKLYGDGVIAGEGSTLDVDGVVVEANNRAGLLLLSSGGSIRRSMIRRNIFAIDLEDRANPFIGDDNQMIDNKINHVTIGIGLKPPPMPSIPKL